MGKPLRVLSLYCFLYLLTYLSFVLSDSNGCHLISCLKCDGNNGTQCTKCSQLVLRSKHCEENSCPPGYHSRWTTLTDYMSTACLERLDSNGLPGEVVGAAVGIVLCLATAIAFGLYCKYTRKRKSSKHPPSLTHSTQSQYFSSDESEREMLEYLREIRELRKEAPVFLDMLNETRRQVRALPSYSALQPYKPVLKDLSRILILLNRPEGSLAHPPPDWETLLAWAHRILNRYKKHHSNQVNELESFFQGEPSQFGLSTFDSNYNKRKRASSEYIEWEGTTQLEDFFSLGFRPQDEITTEL